MINKTLQTDAKWWRKLGNGYETKRERIVWDDNKDEIIPICNVLENILSWSITERRRKQQKMIRIINYNPWYSTKISMNGHILRAIACYLIADMIEAGDFTDV